MMARFDCDRSCHMKKICKGILPFLLIVVIIASIGWYLFVYDRDFTRDMLLQQARNFDARGNSSLSSWFYDLAYRHSGQDQNVAIELANQYKADGNYTKAEYTLTNAIADSPTVELYTALCKTYLEQDKLLDAIHLLDNIANPTMKAQLDDLRPAAPTASPEPGFYSQYIPVTLQSEEGKVYYSTTTTYPSLKTDLFTEAFTLPIGETCIHAVTVSDSGLVSSLWSTTYTVGGVVELVNFTDEAIEAAVREILGVRESDDIYTNQLWDISEFTVPEDAKTFDDIAWMPYLKNLTAENMNFPSLDFLKDLLQLESLSFTGCDFPPEDLATLASLPALETLILSDCSLSTIAALEGCPKLVTLDLSDNTIRHLEPISGVTTLKELHLQHNALSDLSALSTLVNLTVLDVSYNSITSLTTISACSKLSELNVSHNSLSSLEGLDAMTGLTKFLAESNALSDISILGNCAGLTELDISGNTIADISALGSLNALETLDFSYNQVETLPVWSDDSVLYSINGSYNQLKNIDSLKNQEHLAYVYMDYNSLTSIEALASCHHLVMVNVYGNTISSVSALTDQSIIVNYDPTTNS